MDIVTDKDFKAQVLESKLPVLVDFYADWCGPCRQMLPIMTELADELKDKVKIVKINVDSSQETPAAYGVMNIPTFILFKNGQVAGSKAGSMSKSKMAEWLNGQQ